MKNPQSLLNQFLRNESGNFVLIFAVVVFAIAITAGLAVDYSRISNARTKMQNSADGAVLVAALETDKTDKKRKKLARKAYKANYSDLKIKKFKTIFDSDSVTVEVTSNLKMSFMGLVGYNKVPITVSATANQSGAEVEVALVLDVSGSMNATLSGGSSRISELKKAALQLVDEVESTGSAKVAVVPFTMNVNIGTANSSLVTGTDHELFNGTSWMGCVQERALPDHVSNKPSGKFHAYIWPPTPDEASAGICKNPSNGTNSGYKSLDEANPALTTNPYNAQLDGPNRNCVRHSIQPLSSNMTNVKDHINSLTSEGNDGTIIAPGVTWGLRALSPEEPFTEGDAWNNNTYKYMVVLTDGSQTTEIEYQSQTCNSAQSSNEAYLFKPTKMGLKGDQLSTYGPVDNWTPYGFIADSDPFSDGTNTVAELPDSLESLSLSACSEAKKKHQGSEIEIFTIGISDATAPGTRVYNLLNDCASKPENHFYAGDAASLEAAFSAITTRVKNLRLTK